MGRRQRRPPLPRLRGNDDGWGLLMKLRDMLKRLKQLEES
jgi:hypothetical protein